MEGSSFLPPGFRFCPTDEDLVVHFLYHKASLSPSASDYHYSTAIIPHLQLHLFDPWQFHGKALSNGDIHYFFSTVKESRETESGFWKDLYMDEPIFSSTTGNKVGIKKHHIFFIDDPSSAIQTSWFMQEYHLCSYLFSPTTDESHQIDQSLSERQDRSIMFTSQENQDFGFWVLCRVFEAKDNNGRSIFSYEEDEDNESELSFLDEMFLSLDDVI